MKRLLPLLLLLLSPAVAIAADGLQTAPQPAAPQAAPQAARLAPEGLEFFVGSWRADAVDPATGVTETLAYRVETAVGGAWISGAGQSADLSFQARDMWGRDPGTGEFVRVVFPGSGAHVTFRSPGWKGDTLVFQGDVASKDRKLSLRQTIRRVGPDEFSAVWEALRDGEWTAYSVERLTRI